MSHNYQYPRAALTVDCVVFGLDGGELKVLLIERGLEPLKGRWGMPGGFERVDEALECGLLCAGEAVGSSYAGGNGCGRCEMVSNFRDAEASVRSCRNFGSGADAIEGQGPL